LIVASSPNDTSNSAFFSVPTNASLDNISVMTRGTIASGDGGGFVVADGQVVGTGPVGLSTGTRAQSTTNCSITIVLLSADSEPDGPEYTIEPDTTAADEGDTVTYTVTGSDGTVY